MSQLNIVDCMLLWMNLFLRRIVGTTDDSNVPAVHNCLPYDVYDVNVSHGSSMAEKQIRRHVLT